MSIIRNLVIEQGASFVENVYLTDAAGTPVNLTLYSVVSQIRHQYSSVYNLDPTFTFIITIGNPATLGLLTLSLTADTTTTMKAQRYVYDIKLGLGTVITRVVEGIIVVTPQVTLIPFPPTTTVTPTTTIVPTTTAGP